MDLDAGHAAASGRDGYDPFLPGPFAVAARTFQALDTARERRFPLEVWYPEAADGTRARPLVVFSHHSGGNRRSATFLATHLGRHGYLVAALDHSDLVAPELRRADGESDERRAARVAGWIANRVPDVRFLLDQMLSGALAELRVGVDPGRIGIVGHSFGGWTALAAAAADRRLGAVVALAPGGSSRRRPGIIPATMTFDRARGVPTLYLVAEQDTALPLDGMRELFERTPPPRRMVILRRADHLHFVDEVEREHEAMRAIPATGELEWISQMRPIAELCPPWQAHLFVRGLALAHMDATLRGDQRARRLLRGDLQAVLAERGVEAISGP
jgi:dienelactone hydrolase